MSTPEESQDSTTNDAKEALEASKNKEIISKTAPSEVDPSGKKITKSAPQNPTSKKEIEESKGVFDSMQSFYEAITGSGRFEGDSDGVISRIGKAMGKADNITKLLTGAGIMAAVVKVFGELSQEDDSSTEKNNVKAIKDNYKSLSNALNKKKQESDTLASRIEHAMQQQNKDNNLIGYGVAMKSIAMISIKTQEGLSSISDFIYKNNLTLVKGINSLKESIDDINSNNGDVFQGLFPLLIGGIITAFGSFFLGSGGVDGILDTLVQKVVLEIRKDLGIDNEENKNKSIIGTVIEEFIDKIKNSLKLKETELGNLFESLNDLGSSKLINELKKLSNDEKFVKSVSKLLSVITDENQINTFFKNIESISKSTDSIKKSLEEFKVILQNIPIIGSLIGKDTGNTESKNTDQSSSWYEGALNTVIGAFTSITEKAEGLKSISKSLEEMVETIKPFSKLLSKIVEKDSRKEFFEELVSDLTGSFEDAFSKISSGLVEGITKAITELDIKIDDFFNGNKTLRNAFNGFLVELLKNKEVSESIKQTTVAKINEVGVSSKIKVITMASEAGLIDIKNIPRKTIDIKKPPVEKTEDSQSEDSTNMDDRTVKVSDKSKEDVLLAIDNLGALITTSSNSMRGEVRSMGQSMSSIVTAAGISNNQETKNRPSTHEIFSATNITG